jgi:hypothetical protein
MIRPAWLTGCVLLVGCQPPPATPTTPAESATPQSVGGGFPIDYSGWPSLTAEPVLVPMAVFLDCRAPTVPMDDPPRGPHAMPAVRYYAPPATVALLKEGRPPYPVGTTVVKVKWRHEADKAPTAVAAMIKRDAGYDPDHGDWEYVYTTLGEKPETRRGKLESCIQCHRIKKEMDFLFRTYVSSK